MDPREWQADFVDNYFSPIKKEFLLVATPGAGKTGAALFVAKRLLSEGKIDKMIVVCPTSGLKYQWAIKASNHNIDLDPKWKSDNIKSAYQGICLTYGKVISSIDMLSYICRKEKVMIILDEIHHSGDQLAWGDAVQNAFVYASNILGLSGTPFRSDCNEIPFVRYENGNAVSDFSYGYGEAIKDGHCRMLMFPTLDGGSKFIIYDTEKDYDSFNDIDSDKDLSYHLRTLLLNMDKDGYLYSMLIDANDRLAELREFHNDAGGFFKGMSIKHVKQSADLMYSITGEYPTVVTSEDKDTYEKIEAFEKSSTKWIFADKMVSEGIDINRLRVGVYASNVLTEMTFRQIIGRVVRRIGELDDWAFFYVPMHPVLVKMMQRIKEEVIHSLEGKDKTKRRGPRNPEDEDERIDPLIPLDTDRNFNEDLLISSDETYDLAWASNLTNRVNKKYNTNLNEAEVLEIYELGKKTAKAKSNEESKDEQAGNGILYKDNEKLRKQCNGKAFSVACVISATIENAMTPQQVVKQVHKIWYDKPGNTIQKQANPDELVRKLKWLNTHAIKDVKEYLGVYQ